MKIVNVKIYLGVYADFNEDGRMGINKECETGNNGDFYLNFSIRGRIVIYGNVSLGEDGEVELIKRIGVLYRYKCRR